MKKILSSLAVLVAVAAIATGATVAFFSDTETSTDNIFTAGTIDLKVDHTLSYYNGLFCEDEVLKTQCNLENSNLVKNPSFEEPEVEHSAGWDVFESGTPGFDWTVAWADDHEGQPMTALRESQQGINNWSGSGDGDQWAELDSDWQGPDGGQSGEPANTILSQHVPTVPGHVYEVSYQYSPRPGRAENKMQVRVTGDSLSEVRDYSENGSSLSDTNWKSDTITFTADSYATRIAFEETGTADSFGMFLDDVSVIATDCGAENPQEGNSCSSVFGERDLEGEAFFDFEDIKPGDYGRNVISLHVSENDAWACLIAHGGSDDENGVYEPEEELGDAGQPGELQDYLTVFVWQDDNNNGVYDSGEEQAGTASLDELGDLGAFDSSTEGLSTEEVGFVGLAWCAGDISVDEESGSVSCDGGGMLNDAQSDSYSASLTAYAEQQRNNPEFVCSSELLQKDAE